MNDSMPPVPNEEQMKHFLSHLTLEPGEECPGCHRPVPKLRSDAETGSHRETFSFAVPKGDEGLLESMLIALVDKYKEQWPREHAAMRQQVGLEVVGGRAWKYYAVYFAVYSCLMVPGLAPVEEGQ